MSRIFHLITMCLLFVSCQLGTQKNVIDCDFQSILPNGSNVDCGYITVPENHDNPDGRKIKIAYVVLHANDANTNEYPVIYLSGGPGGSSLNSQSINYWYNHPFRSRMDIILLDQRGIGYSSALPNMNKALKDIMSSDASEEEEQLMVKEAISKCVQWCKERGADLRYYNTFQNGRDIGTLMKHLSYKKYNLYGVSYGTRLARVTQDMFPEMLNTVILNSPNPIKGDMLIDRLKGYSLALGRVFEYCKSNPDCKVTNPTLESDYLKAIKALKERPLMLDINGDSIFINAQDGIFFVRRLLYSTNSRTDIPILVNEYLQGGGPMIKQLALNEYPPDYNFTMWLAVERHEMYDPGNTKSVIDQIYDSLPLLPAKLGLFNAAYLNLEELHDSGAISENKTFQLSSVPTMITVNRYDPVTPPENGHVMMEKLSQGHLFILDEGGHGGGDEACRNKVMMNFMHDPTGPLNASCLNIYKE